MQNIVIRIGRVKAISAITLVSILLSVIATVVNLYLFGFLDTSYITLASIFIAVLIPTMVALPVAWVTVNMVFTIYNLEAKTRELVTYDSLTHLLSRRAFFEQADLICRLAVKEGSSFSMLVVDLDDFKQINDTYGHGVGDRVLESFGHIARQIARNKDLMGRIGGEEFAFLLPHTSAEQAWHFAECLHSTIRETVIEDQGLPIRYAVSIGLAYCTHSSTVEHALLLADSALYDAKKNGKNQSVIYDEESRNAATSDLLIAHQQIVPAKSSW